MPYRSRGFVRRKRFGFRAGWLYFCTSSRLYRFRGLPHFIAECRGAGGTWQPLDVRHRDALLWPMRCCCEWRLPGHFYPDGPFFRETETGQTCWPWAIKPEERPKIYDLRQWFRFFATMPDRMVRLLKAFSCDLFSALELVSQAPAALDLALHDRVLAAALARHWEFPAVGQVDWDAVRRHVCKRRRDILGWLGYRASESLANALRRLDIDGLDVARQIQRALTVLDDSFYGPVCTQLGQIDSSTIDVLMNPLTREWLEPCVLRKTGYRLDDCVWSVFRPINRLLSAGVIDRDAARQLSRASPHHRTFRWILPYLRSPTLPVAPVLASFGIEHLDTVAALIDEGETMGHCVGSVYCVTEALVGTKAFYRITSPVRATLALHHQGKGWWELDELEGPRNTPIPSKYEAEIARSFPPNVRWPFGGIDSGPAV